MRRISTWTLILGLAGTLVLGCTTTTTPPPSDSGVEAGFDPERADSDADGILDRHEGRAEGVDTDGDGIQDWEDTDSDNDGIPDFVEAGDGNLSTPPRDTDMDLTPDFRDTDSDNNGISDADEGTEDFDGDGIPDYADLDDDNDFANDLSELDGLYDPPADSDGDGMPNFRDPDSDNDGIMDGDESGADTDRDGLFDNEDTDSDNDGVPDSVEAGDDDLRSPPIDSDGDLIPDFRDPDSDNDGLSDAFESEYGTSLTEADSDGDSVSDLIEFAAGTDPRNRADSPLTRGDFVFVVPFEEAPTPARDTLEFRTNIQFADIYFLFDISGSMGGVISALRTAVGDIMSNLTCMDTGRACRRDSDCTGDTVCSFSGTCIENPAASSCVASPWTGAGYYEIEMVNLLSLQSDPAATSAALSVSVFGGTEQLYGAVWSVFDPVASPIVESGCDSPTPGRIGCVSYREEAVRILVAFTDEDSDGTETVTQAADALNAASTTFIGVWSSSGTTGRSDLVDLANASGSLDRTGAPLVFDGRDSGVVPVVTAAINEIVEGVPLRVTIEATDELDDAGDALQFIDFLEINTSGGACSAVAPLEDTDGDGRNDAFPGVRPGTPVCWDVVPAMNTSVEPEADPLVFRARLTVYGDSSPLDSRVVYFLVPPVIPEPGGPD